MDVDKKYMDRAIALATLAEGRTHPNPMVGAVVVRKGQIVGEGFHRQAGGPHAEIEALKESDRRARDADLYVTLEPCCHVGRTPPCTEAILHAGVRRVIYGMRDPHREVRGRGLAALRRSGVTVIGPIGEKECRALNPSFIHWATTGRPYIIGKIGATLDGKIADAEGHSRWITNAATRAYMHQWRARVDGILIGRHTLVADDPALTIRLPRYRGPQPQPIVLVGNGPIPRRRRLVAIGAERPALWVVPPHRRKAFAWLDTQGHDVVTCPLRDGKYDLLPLLRLLGDRGMTSLLVEGGGTTMGGFLRAGLLNYVIVSIAPMILGNDGRSWTEGVRISTLRRAIQMHVVTLHRFGDNVVVEGVIQKGR